MTLTEQCIDALRAELEQAQRDRDKARENERAALAYARRERPCPTCEGLRDELLREKSRLTLEAYFAKQIQWSHETFGPERRTGGVLQHIRKELAEIEAKPHDLSEWVDVVILAMDGYWRHGGGPSTLLPALQAKQERNMARTWPDWRTLPEDVAIEHDRSGEAREVEA